VVVRIGAGSPDLDASDSRITLFMNSSLPILNNNGDELLLDSGGTAFDFFAYGPGSLVDYPPLGVHWDGRNLTSRAGQSLSAFPDGLTLDEPGDWLSLPASPGMSNGDYQTGENDMLITEVYYNNQRDDEYICLVNHGTRYVNITGWTITDHEAEVSFPSVTIISPGVRLCVTHNSTSYYEDLLKEADFTYAKGDADPMWTYGGKLALRNDGDEVVLLTQYGREVDSLLWGQTDAVVLGWESEPANITRKGAAAKRQSIDGRFLDSNSSNDWNSLEDFGIGRSDFEWESFTVKGPVTSFYSPGTSLKVLREVLGNATDCIQLNAYQLTSRSVGDELAKAAMRGVEVRVLLEGEPVSGIPQRELTVITELAALGVHVRLLVESPDEGIFKRFSYNHAKYAIIDNRSLLLSSENWGNGGYPDDNTGNRGWGVVVEDRDLAAHFSAVFAEDWNPLRRESMTLDEAIDRLDIYEDEDYYSRQEEPHTDELKVSDDVEVIAVIGPDNSMDSETIMGMIDSAQNRILVQQFYIRKTWKVGEVDLLNPFLDSLVRAGERGCEVRVLLDSTWYNVLPDDSNDNDDTVEFLNSVARRQNLNISAKLMDLDAHGIVKLHNKGIVVDGNRVLVSSLNWNHNSFSRNREAGLILQNPQLAGYFEDIFMHDWKDDVSAPVARIEGPEMAEAGDSIVLSALNSYDDRGIARFSWDLDSDGIEDLRGATVNISYPSAGTFTIVLEVEDYWGNIGTASVDIVVRDANDPARPELVVAAIGLPATSLSLLLYHFK
jgi:phosphatidylserine/phosphatidylglycerophosphate/cardiolipin synthase-like enzyme